MINFAEQSVSYPDGQQNVGEPPQSVMLNGFIPETAGARGQPLPAQWFNWLLQKIFRHINRDRVTDETGVSLFNIPDSVIRLEAIDRADPNKYIVAIGFKNSVDTVYTLKVVSSSTLTLGTPTIDGDQPILGGADVVVMGSSRQFGVI